LQIGLSLRDRWGRSSLFLPDLLLGAPPSRTNPEGQPWGYPVLDPRQYLTRYVPEGTSSAVLDFVRMRVDRLFEDFDGIRIDHPHGLVCPWVYDAHDSDPHRAVLEGARLFETPTGGGGPYADLLRELAIARADQINEHELPYEDDRVHTLDDAQVTLYSRLFDLIVERAIAAGRAPHDILCEVLSTCPRPLECVMARHDLGRFRVTQKADLRDRSDGYRGENANAHDWTMIGNHDTRPLRLVIERWTEDGSLAERAAYLASRLEPAPSRREAFVAWLLQHKGHFTTAMFAELLVGPATNVLVFWTDLFGERDIYNVPGLVSGDNWSMRLPRDFRALHRSRVDEGHAPDMASVVALALRAHGIEGDTREALTARARFGFDASSSSSSS
jgi:4-alpha-glucanotransferase